MGRVQPIKNYHGMTRSIISTNSSFLLCKSELKWTNLREPSTQGLRKEEHGEKSAGDGKASQDEHWNLEEIKGLLNPKGAKSKIRSIQLHLHLVRGCPSQELQKWRKEGAQSEKQTPMHYGIRADILKKSYQKMFNFENWFLGQFSSNTWFFLAVALSTPQKLENAKRNLQISI